MSVNPYASKLAGQNAREVIADTPRQLAALAERLGPDGFERSLAAGKWRAREILCHLADVELVFAFRLRQALAEPHHVIQPMDQDAWSARQGSVVAQPTNTTVRKLSRSFMSQLADNLNCDPTRNVAQVQEQVKLRIIAMAHRSSRLRFQQTEAAPLQNGTQN